MSDMTDGTWEFYDAWAAFPHTKVQETDRRIVGEFCVATANRDETAGSSGEFAIRFYQFHRGEHWRPTEIAARLEAFGDAWAAIASNPDLIGALAVLGAQPQQTPDAVRTVLLRIGMTDVTAKLRGTHPAHCPTCHGKGVLDDVAPAEADSTCVSCLRTDDPTTRLRVNPYKEEIGGDSTPELLCDGCTTEAAGDI